MTAAAVLLFLLGERVPLPLLDADGFRMIARSDLSAQLSWLALGVMPFVNAFVMVEVVALAVPRLRGRRNGSAADRLPLARAAWVAAVLLAAAQAWGIATYLQSISTGPGRVLLDPGTMAALGVASALVVGTVAAGSVAAVVSRRGLGNGFAVLLAAGGVEATLRVGRRMILRPRFLWTDVSLLAVLSVAVLIVVLAWRPRRDAGADGPHVPVPTCGLALVQIPPAVLALPATLMGWFSGLAPLADLLRPGTAAHTVVSLSLAAALALGFSRLFCAPGAVLRAYDRAFPESGDTTGPVAVRGALASANRRSLALVLAVAAAPAVADVLGVPVRLDATRIFLLFLVLAVAADVRDEARARASGAVLAVARPLHRVYAVAPALQALSAAGIPAFASGVRFRAMFHFFAPYAPIEILVPPERATEAGAICERIVADAPPA